MQIQRESAAYNLLGNVVMNIGKLSAQTFKA